MKMGFIKTMKGLFGREFPRDMNQYQNNSLNTPVLRNLDLFQSIQGLAKENSISTIFDVGGNAGDFSWQFSQLYSDAQIYCFEPSPRSYESLVTRFSRNSKISIHNIAVSDGNGTADFHCYKVNPTDSLLMPAIQWRQWVDGKSDALELQSNITVTTTTLDTFCSNHAISTIDILKIDTQGAECKILDGAKNLLSRHAVNFLILEMLFVPVYKNQPYFFEVCRKLADYGYSLVNLYNIRYDDDENPLQIKWADGIFVYRGW